jgi:hypothetical protein
MCTRARPYGRIGRCGFGGWGVTVDLLVVGVGVPVREREQNSSATVEQINAARRSSRREQWRAARTMEEESIIYLPMSCGQYRAGLGE